MIKKTGDFLNMANQLQEKLVMYRHHLHGIPELDLSLPRTTADVQEVLESMGLTPTPVGESGLMVTIGGQRPGKVILIRADMDGLPMKEEADISFASLNGNMHACGHGTRHGVSALISPARLRTNSSRWATAGNAFGR